ncbi:MAG: DUF167 domain-containing protein [Candidatus Bathyarchaeia archaeon]
MIFEVHVTFHKDFIERDGNKINVGLTSKPVMGRANKELLKKLAEHFNVPTSNIRIISGFGSRNKIVEIKFASNLVNQ